VGDLRLSEDGLYYWDGRQWISTLSPDGRSRWNGYTWVPVASMAPMTPMVPQAYPYYRQPATVRVPTPWTKPMQYAVAAAYVLAGLYTLSEPFWMSGVMTQAINQSLQRQAQVNPNVSPPPPELVSSMSSMMSGMFWVAAIFVAAICAVIAIGALMRWTWIFWVVLVLLGLGALFLPFSLFTALAGYSYPASSYGLPAWTAWVSVVFGVPGTALFVWMLVALIRYGPWATTRTSPSTVSVPAPAS
jgi:hypothetical protein